jgi:transposase
MGVRLEKLVLPSHSQIEELPMPELLALAKDWRTRLELYQEQLFRERRHRYGKRSERGATDSNTAIDTDNDKATPTKEREDVTKRPSERYPDAPVHVEKIDLPEAPPCPCCGDVMVDSGMTENSESISVREKKFIVIEQQREKYRCVKCHGAIVTAPAPARVMPGGSYSDELLVDATVSKYCDLIPMERYSRMAARGGMAGLPPQSLIQGTFNLAEFMDSVYERIRKEVLDSTVVLADETPHRMLEGDARTRWYLWGFSAEKSVFFECHSTRSGDVSSAVLMASRCEVLLTDVYSGYAKSVREVNAWRAASGIPSLTAAYCNAHARRGFVTGDDSGDAKYMVEQYREIYRLEASRDGAILDRRAKMRSTFEAMRETAEKKVNEYSSKSQLRRAYSYFLENYEGLTVFLSRADVSIDNNASERALRNHVIGRKTWYGTHSPAGAEVAAVHFTIVESCKMNEVNPREYYLDMVGRLHRGEGVVTPSEYQRQVLLN